MAASYPGTIKTFSTKAPGEAIASSHINDLQNEIVAVETQLGVNAGAWQNWTPTIGYTGGSGTPTISAGGRYMIVGKIVYLLLTGLLTRNGATHAYLSFTTPTSIAKFGSGSFTHQFLASFSLSPVYKAVGGAVFDVRTGTWTNDGLYWFSGFYEMP